MIWLFEVDEVFWDNKPKVNEYYTFDTNDIEFDIAKYDVSLYFGTAGYYLLSESNDKEIYQLRFVGVDINPVRLPVSDKSEIYDIVRNFYTNKKEKQK